MKHEMGKRIKQLRKQHKYTQKQVADFLDISQSLLAKVEKGERNLKLTKLSKLCALYDCTEEYILYGEGTPPNDLHISSTKGLSLETIMKMNKIIRNLQEMSSLYQHSKEVEK